MNLSGTTMGEVVATVLATSNLRAGAIFEGEDRPERNECDTDKDCRRG